MAKEISDFMDITPDWLTCQLFFVIFLKFLGIKKVAFYDRKPLKLCLTEWHCIYNSGTESVKFDSVK